MPIHKQPVVGALLSVVLLATTGLLAQTAIKLPKNKYTPKQDVELGREAAAEVRKQYPIITDERHHRATSRTLGDRLVAARRPSSSNRSTSTRSRR